jgi:hypothetical protein
LTPDKPTKGGVRAYARHRGLKSDNSVRKALAAGRIRYEADGKTIDFAKADEAWSKNTDPTQQRETKPAAPPAEAVQAGDPAAIPPVPPAPPGAKPTATVADHPIANGAIATAVSYLNRAGLTPTGADGGVTLVDARTADLLQKMEKRQLEIDAQRGDVVPKKQIVDRFFALARQERDAWQQWVVRNIAEMVADLKKAGVKVDAQALEVVLNRHVARHLAELAELKL